MAIEDLFTQWEDLGIFSFALPFLLIFALIFGILTKTNLFGTKDNPNKKINAIIALVVALISLQFNFVSSFFSDLFPRFGIALAIILLILLSIGLFADLENKKMKWILGGIVLVALIAVLWVPLSNLGIEINLNGFFERNFGWMFFVLLVIGLVIWAVAGGEKKTSESSPKEEK
jgi:hypothetical protein